MVFCLSEILNVCLDGILPTHKPVQKSSNGRFMWTVDITLKMSLFSQEFLILRQYYILAPHASLYLITQIDTYMTEQKWLICGGKERLKSMVALANTGSMFSDLLECQYTGGVMALSISHVQVIFLKVNNCHCLMFWHRLLSDKTY